MWLAQEVIRRKRDGLELAGEDIRRFVEGISDSSLSEGQVAAFAMAVLLKGMSLDERIALTTAMRDSGQVLEWKLPGPVVDKHSTGGVGDLVSLVLAPLLAACGCYVPMISGRGLGHTGGTLDKLESIPGYCTRPDPERLRTVVAEVGCAIIGQTADLAPADKRLYGIRDVTGTVESVDLITASILAKKLAAGLDVLIMDVKSGNGAFMSDPQQADLLARSLVAVANGAGVRTRAVISDMNQPLARSAGNALEVEEALALLKGEVRSPRLWEVTLVLAEETLVAAGLAEDCAQARERLLQAWRDGAALQRFNLMVDALGGPGACIASPGATCPGRRWCTRCMPSAAVSSRRWIPAPSASRWSPWAAVASARRTRSTRRWASARWRCPGKGSETSSRWGWCMLGMPPAPSVQQRPCARPINWAMARHRSPS
ncbi:hypothetical protein PSm6_12160 [Pseudomonas solani]|uniref:thymidine phosphorylase n=1 Tax=Pseudomonas solani TaxID=2731552 RepID=A0ABM7L5G3_9PSED|nr:hypothetical protein PSm6_12160 [Pseudomonas solani]